MPSASVAITATANDGLRTSILHGDADVAGEGVEHRRSHFANRLHGLRRPAKIAHRDASRFFRRHAGSDVRLRFHLEMEPQLSVDLGIDVTPTGEGAQAGDQRSQHGEPAFQDGPVRTYVVRSTRRID